MPNGNDGLHEIYRRKQKDLARAGTLIKKRDRLVTLTDGKIAGLDKQIAVLVGGTATNGHRKPHAKNDRPLADYIESAIKKRGPGQVANITRQIVADGYKTNSDNLASMVSQIVSNDKRFRPQGARKKHGNVWTLRDAPKSRKAQKAKQPA